MLSLDDVALFRCFPGLKDRVPWVRLGDWPTPVERLDLPGARVPVYVKREDLSSPRYGGNKVRTLEAMMGLAVGQGATCIWATGAYGSNHATATVLHAAAAGLDAGVALFPQPPSVPARQNLAAMLSGRPRVRPMVTPVELPLVMAWLGRRPGAFVMPPGGATPRGAMGALSAALELAEQVQAGQCPAPARIVLAVGSACTTAGLLAGLHLAGALGIGFVRGTPVPAVTTVRVTPWPVTSRARMAHLAYRTSLHIAALTGVPATSFARLHAGLDVEARYFGSGYGRITASGYRAAHALARAGGPPLDIVYSAKSGAALLDLARRGSRGPLLFWATKSSVPLPGASLDEIARAPRAWRDWLREPA
jgi:D-cysteine desulfhydrase